MGFFSFLGRVLFASVFILSTWQMFNEFDAHGGPAVNELIPKVTALRTNLAYRTGIEIRVLDVKNLVATVIFLKGVGGILFVLGNTLGASLLLLYLVLSTPLLYDFYNFGPGAPEYGPLLNDFVQSLGILGALLFFIGMKNSIPRRQLKKRSPKTKAVEIEETAYPVTTHTRLRQITEASDVD